MDFRDLLIKYIRPVQAAEGVTLIYDAEYDRSFTKDEVAALKACELEAVPA